MSKTNNNGGDDDSDDGKKHTRSRVHSNIKTNINPVIAGYNFFLFVLINDVGVHFFVGFALFIHPVE